ncbi:MAG: ABC transporter transmembrane domain-containing protein, partial [Jiangellales bacterium]
MIALLTRFLRPYRGPLAIVAVLLLVQAFGNLYLPELNADIINNGVVLGDTEYILRVGVVMLAVTLVVGVAAIIGVYYSARTAMGFGRDVRGGLFRSVQTFSLREVNEFGAPSLITRNTNDVQQVQMLVIMALTIMVSAPIMAVG